MQRPLIHFAPAKGWMNDPNGPIYADGLWHLFYQYNPFGSEWGNICWAYATSPDLISWTRRGVRLAPDTAHGERWCFSGCTVPTPHGYAFLYTSVGFGENAARDRAVQRICASNRSFTRTRRCGTITPDLHPLPVTEWRDPFVFERGGTRYLLLAGVMNGKGNILLYKAADESLLHWKFLCPLFSRAGDILECPNAVMFGDTMLLLYSSIRENRVRYAVGRFAGGQLAVAAEGVVDHGENCFYATNLARGEHGGTVLFAWLKESLLHGSSPDGSYSGCLALPRTVHLENGRPVYARRRGGDPSGNGKRARQAEGGIGGDAYSARGNSVRRYARDRPARPHDERGRSRVRRHRRRTARQFVRGGVLPLLSGRPRRHAFRGGRGLCERAQSVRTAARAHV